MQSDLLEIIEDN